MKFQITITKNSFGVSDFHRAKLNDYVHKNGECRAIVEILTPESKKLRGYVMGGLLPLAVYLDGGDYEDDDVCDFYFEEYKKEFTPEYQIFKGERKLKGASSKGRKALKNFAEKLLDYLEEQHGIEYGSKVTSPTEFKNFRDKIYPYELQYKNWIDYIRKLNWIK